MADDNAADAHSRGETVESTRDQARNMAKILTEGMSEGEPAREGQLDKDTGIPNMMGKVNRAEQDVESLEQALSDTPPVEAAPVDAGEVAAVEEVVEAIEEAGVEITTELLDELADRGIELGIDPASVDEALRPAYQKLIEGAMNVADRYTQVDTEAAQLRMERDELSQKFENEPEKILLAMSVAKPEAFQQAVEIYNKMQQNPEYAEMVARELASEARVAEADRRDKLADYRARMDAGNRLKAECNRQAARLGVDPTLAAKQVALAITANDGNPIPVTDIRGILEPLAGAGRKSVRQAVRTPEQQKAVQNAPQTPSSEGVAPEQGVESAPSRGRQSKFRGIIGNALRKGTASEQ
jgi:hypothetical protein